MSNIVPKLDPIWAAFDRIAPNKAKCRNCEYLCAPFLDRLKKHFLEVHGDCMDTENNIKAASTTQQLSERVSATKNFALTILLYPLTHNKKRNFTIKSVDFFFPNNLPFQAVKFVAVAGSRLRW